MERRQTGEIRFTVKKCLGGQKNFKIRTGNSPGHSSPSAAVVNVGGAFCITGTILKKILQQKQGLNVLESTEAEEGIRLFKIAVLRAFL